MAISLCLHVGESFIIDIEFYRGNIQYSIYRTFAECKTSLKIWLAQIFFWTSEREVRGGLLLSLSSRLPNTPYSINCHQMGPTRSTPQHLASKQHFSHVTRRKGNAWNFKKVA